MNKNLLLIICLLLGISGAKAQTYLTEDFEGGALPSGWSQITAATDGGWNFGINTDLQSASFPIPAHTKFACTNDDKCNCMKNNDLLCTGAIDLSSATNAVLQYDNFYFNGTYSGITESAKIAVSTDGGVTWTDAITVGANTTGWQTNYADLSAYAGNADVRIGFRYGDGGGWLFGWAIDNVMLFNPAANDAGLSAITPTTGSAAAYSLAGSNVSLGGTILNQGLNTITGFTVKYSDGVNTYSDTKSGLSIASFQNYQFTHNTPYTVPATGLHNLTMWVELTGDANQANDTLTTAVNGVAFFPNQKIVFEEATGTWCGWCPRGTVFMDSMHNVNPNTTVLIAVHNGDPMVNAAYDQGVGTLISGYPSALANRGTVIDPSDMFTYYNAHYGDFAFADINATCNINMVTRVATADVDAHFATDLSGDYRLAVVFTEDYVSGTTSTWAQHNYYSYQSQNLPLVGAGFNWQAEPQIIPASQMHYNHVARTIVGGFTGQTGSLPATIAGGSTSSYTFSYTIPAGYNINNMHCNAVLIDATNKQILNGNEGTIILAIDEISAGVIDAVVFPNPVSDVLNLNLSLNKSTNVSITVTDVLGKVYSATDAAKFSTGSYELKMDASTLSSGVYFLNIKTNDGVVTRKFVK